MNSSTNKYFNYQRTNTDPNINKKIKIKAKLLNDFNNKIHLNSPIKYNSIQKYPKKNKSKINDYYNLIRSQYVKKNYSFSFQNGQQMFCEKKNMPNNSMNINNLFENSFIAYNNKSIYENNLFNKKNNLAYASKVNNDNSTNISINLVNELKKSKILDNNKNDNLKVKFERLLDVALKNENNNGGKNNKIKNNIEIKKFVNIEKVIEKIRNKNRKILFKKKIELNMPHKRIVNVQKIKKNLNEKLFEKLNDSHLNKSINLKNNVKKNKSFKNSFMHLNHDINYKRNLSNNNSYILNIQNIYRSNSKVDYNKKIINDENIKNFYNTQNRSKINYKLKYLKTELSFF